MGKAIRMIGIDLDGTLLTGDKVLTEYSRQTLAEAAGLGIEVVPVTGRPLAGVPREVLDIPGIRYCIASNGANTYDLQEHKVLRKAHLPHAVTRRILGAACGDDVIREIFLRGVGYHDQATHRMLEERFSVKPPILDYINRSRRIVPNFEALLSDESAHVENVSLMFPSREDRDQAFGRLKKIRGEGGERILHILLPWMTDLEITHVLADKWLALSELAQGLAIDGEEVMALGDGDNDRPMLRGAGLSVAMGNAPDFVKETADEIADDNEHDGAARAVREAIRKAGMA